METGIVQIRSHDDLTAVKAHAKLHRFYTYWQSIHPAEGMPGRQHVDPLKIPNLLPGIWLVDVTKPLQLRYRLIGTRVVEAMGADMTGLWLDEAHPDVARDPKYLSRAQDVVNTGIPSWRRGSPYLWRHEVYGDIENLMVPLARDSRSVDMLMVLTVFYRPDGTSC